MNQFLYDQLDIKAFDVNSTASTLSIKEELNKDKNSCQLVDHQDVNYQKVLSKLILLLKYFIFQNLLKIKNKLSTRIKNSLKRINGNQPEDPIILSHTNQFAGLLIYFQEQYPHFQKFKIKLPHARNNYVAGVGDPKRAVEFYSQLNDCQIFGKTDIDSLRIADGSPASMEPIPDGFVSWLPTENS